VASEGPRSADPARVEEADLRAASISGVRWVTLARLIAEAIALGSTVVLARLIPPAEFGHAVVALGFAAIALGIAWLGFGTTLIQMPSVEREDVEVATFLSVATGLTLTLATVALSPYVIAPVFGGREAYLLMLVSPIFLLSGLSTVPNALLQRRLAFRRTSQIEILSLAAGPAVSITLAATIGLNAEALVFGALTTALVGTTLALLSAPPTGVRWRRREASRIAHFGAFAALVGVTGTLQVNIDYMILGARLPARQVGFYWRAYTLGIDYQSKISGIMTRLALPLFSRASDRHAMRRLREKMLRIHTIVLYPILTTLIALAPEVVPLVYGPRWEPAVFPTQVLAIAGMAAVAAVGTASLMFAIGKPRQLFNFFLIWLIGYALVVTWASSYGLRPVVIAVAIYQVALVSAQFYVLDFRQVGIPLRESWRAIRPGLVASGISLAAAYPTARALEAGGTADFAIILVAGTLAVAVYALMLRFLFPTSWRELFNFIRSFLGRRKGGASEAAAAPE
jgi:lipopolysaccharide exporter